jgi:hypothetical protein
VLTYYFRNRDTGTIWCIEATEQGILREAYDTEYKLYPLIWINWDYIRDCYHGQAMVTGLLANQKFINKMFALVGISLLTTAFPKVVYNKNFISRWDGSVGTAVGVTGNVNDCAKVLDGASISPQIAQFIELSFDKTHSLLGASDVAMGDSRPDNTSAIIALQRAANTPMELTKQNDHQCLEDAGRIFIDIMSVRYGTRMVEMNMDMDGLFIADDQLLFPTEVTEKYAYEFFSRLKDLNYKKSIFLSGSAMLTKDEKLLRLVKDAGVDHLYCVTGFDPISMKAVTHDMPEEAETNFKRMRDAGLEIFASVTMGLESDTKDIFEKHLKFLERNKIRFVEFWLATPYPGTPMWRKYKAKNRILTEDFDLYNGAHCVFQPKKMTKEEMEEGFLYCWKEFFTRFPLDPAEAMKYYNLTEEYQKKHGLISDDDKADK